MRGSEFVGAWASVVWQVFGIDWDLSRQRVIGAEQFNKLQIAAEGGVVAEVTVKT